MNIAIIGARLSGLALARALQHRGINYTLYEARERTGGRVLSYPGWTWGQLGFGRVITH